MENRTCSRCKEEKLITEFAINKPSKGGRLKMCKKCVYKNYVHATKKWKNMERFGGVREVVLKRDEYKCVACGMTRAEHVARWKRDITVDHIDGNGRYSPSQNNNLKNLQTLCLSCHGRKDTVRYQNSQRI